MNEQSEESTMDKYLDSHPDAERKLETHPNLAKDGAFLKTYPASRDLKKRILELGAGTAG